ncbi:MULTISPECIES: insulinase family protein [unclassified Nitrospina]|uniref:insulinase family protein n=1 Tax=unclassified Nitrospina TaxID=2638683 RepID=UPI003F9CA12B
MSFEVDRSYHGFKLKKQEKLKELNSLALFFEHEKTGAELLVMENDDDNKVFSATFRTPPFNDTGVAHILEHSVLCGSQKFPVKEPFVELMKGSLQTFLNAMTFPDKTMYPVASRNRKDFFNLMTVYLDAVFYPKITEEIFKQEGWHYELDAPEGDITYKGVVYNEMKGVFSNPESVLDRHLAHSLFPKTPYGYESGGDPLRIPQLTYDEFKEFHRKYYHPTNSRLFIYGDGDTNEYLKYLNEEYLIRFDRLEVDSHIGLQRRFSKPKWKDVPYAVSKNESVEKKTYVVVGMKLGKATDYEHCLAMEILSHILLGNSAAPLRKALLQSNLGSEVIGGGFDDNRAETLFAVGMKGADREDAQKILDLVFDTLKDLAENGIDEDQIKASVNTIDFKLREANFGGFPKGIVYNIQALGSWLYDADPMGHLKYEKLMKKIKKMMNEGYFETLIKKHLLDNNHRSVLVLYPKPGLGEKQDAKVRKALREMKSGLSDKDIENLIEETRALQEMQMAPDAPEALATLPRLHLNDVEKKVPKFPCEVKRKDKPTVLLHDLFTNNIAYTQICFDTNAVPQDQIQYLGLLGRMILGMGTKKRDYVEMSQQIGIHTGGISPSHFSSVTFDDRSHLLSHLNFSGTVLMEKLDALFDLYAELFTERDFSNTGRLVEIIRSAKANMETSIVPHGNQYVLSRLQAYHSRLGQYDEWTDGLTYFRFLEDLYERVEKDPEAVADEFRQVADRVLNRDNMLVNITSPAKDFSKIDKRVKHLTEILPEGTHPRVDYKFEAPAPNEGFMTTSTVQYVGKGANLYQLGYQYSGKFEVVKALLRTAFLWDRIRVQGGAYGSMINFDLYTGDLGLVSYRDPNLSETLDVYDEIGDFLAHLDLPGEELEKIIIGCIGKMDPPLTPDRKGSISRAEYLTGMTQEFKERRLEELMSTTLEDVRGYAELFHAVKEKGSVCVLGNAARIKKDASRFDHLVDVFK